MAKYTDSKGNEWVVNITAAGILRVSRAVNLTIGDLFAMTEGDLEIANKFGPHQLIDAFYALLEPQVKARGGISKDDFLEAHDLSAIKAAVMAVAEAAGKDFPKAEPKAVDEENPSEESDEGVPL